jgi:LytS/YehU family sensor histidine kinase
VNHINQIEELKTQYETEKKENEIVKLNKDNRIQELQLEKDAATKNRLMIIIAATILVLIIVGSMAGFLYKTVQEKKKAFVQLQIQSEELNRQSRLISKYQSQMNPHFVFNALNSIQGTVITDEKEKTIDRLQLLSQLMRQTLNNSENENISLDTEIKYLQTYIKFEKEKLNSALKFEVKYPEDHSDILIPPMMIQPFIENAIKHAGLKQINHPLIGLDIIVENGFLKVHIKDNGEGFDAKDSSVLKNSHAIKMIRSRLQLLFLTENNSSNLRFEIISKPVLERGTEVKFYLPLKYKY